jgi:hypothetical protein
MEVVKSTPCIFRSWNMFDTWKLKDETFRDHGHARLEIIPRGRTQNTEPPKSKSIVLKEHSQQQNETI